MMNNIRNVKNILDKIIMGICIALFVFMLIVGSYQIISRYLLKDPSVVSEELVTYSFTWMAMFSAAYVFGKREHMSMVFFVERLSKKLQLNISILSEVVILLFAFFVLICGGKTITTLTLTQITPALRVSMGYIYSVLPICGVVISLYSIFNILELVEKLKEEV